jgi:hypothetical protein
MPPSSLKSLKAKSVLRVGGVAALQDMQRKTYATGLLDAVRGEVRTLERYYARWAPPAMFSRVDRARLFCATVEQDDVKSKSRGGTNMSYVDSIRASI